MPLNRDTEKIYYERRLIIDGNIVTEPRAWEISKINRISPNGILRATLSQNVFNQYTDYCEIQNRNNPNDDHMFVMLDELLPSDHVYGWWADFGDSGIEPSDNLNVESKPNRYSVISYSGAKPEIKVGGNYKKLTVDFYKDNELDSYDGGYWSYTIEGNNASAVINEVTSSIDLDVNQVKIKFIGGDEYVGKNLLITHTSSSGIQSTLEIAINAL